MNPRQLRLVKKNLQTIDSFVAECEKVLSMANEGITNDNMAEFVSLYDAVNSKTGVGALYSGIPQPHASEIKRGVDKFNDKKAELRNAAKRNMDRMRKSFEEEYARVSEQSKLEKKDLQNLDKIAESYSTLKRAFDRFGGAFFSGFFGKDPVPDYIEAKSALEGLEKEIGEVVERYTDPDTKTKVAFEELQDHLSRLSAEKKKITESEVLLGMAYKGNEEATVREIEFIAKNFNNYMREESNLRKSNESLKEKRRHLKCFSGRKDPAKALKELDKIEKQERLLYVFGRTSRFRQLLEENTALFDDVEKMAGEKKSALTGKVLDKVSDTYRFVEVALSQSVDSEGYETLMTRAKQRLEGAKSDLDIASCYRNVSQEEKKYKELSAAVDSRISEVASYKHEKENGTRLEEKALDVQASQIELEKMKLTKKERIRRMELQTAETMRHDRGEKPKAPERAYRPAPDIICAPNKDFYSLCLNVRRLEAPEDTSVSKLGGLILSRKGRWREMVEDFTEYLNSDSLNPVSGEKNIGYLKGLRKALSKSMENGTLTYSIGQSPQVKQAADKALASLDGYIERCCKEAT